MRTQRNTVTGIAAALALTACGITAGSSGGTPAGHPAAASAGDVPASTWATEQGDIASVKRHVVWMGGDPGQAQRPQADPSWVTDQRELAKVKQDVVLHAGQQARSK